MAKIAATFLARRGVSFLLNEERMIELGLFPRLHARFRRCKSFPPFFSHIDRCIMVDLIGSVVFSSFFSG